jgi:nickel/cobalt transporter (NicO) family protein
MTTAILMGASSGALHAVTGPDHVLSLGPMVLGSRGAPWRIGARWGAGHALGTLLLALPVLWLAERVHLPLLASVGERLAGLALLLSAAWSFYQVRRAAREPQRAAPREGNNALLIGVIHGLTGAASLMLVVPYLAAGSRLTSAVFLLAFSLGSTLAMAWLTSALARVGARLDAGLLLRSRKVLCAASGALGAFWLMPT